MRPSTLVRVRHRETYPLPSQREGEWICKLKTVKCNYPHLLIIKYHLAYEKVIFDCSGHAGYTKCERTECSRIILTETHGRCYAVVGPWQ